MTLECAIDETLKGDLYERHLVWSCSCARLSKSISVFVLDPLTRCRADLYLAPNMFQSAFNLRDYVLSSLDGATYVQEESNLLDWCSGTVTEFVAFCKHRLEEL